MEIDTSVYALLILYSLAVGAALGVVYDIFRIRRIAWSPSGEFSHLIRIGKRRPAHEPPRNERAASADGGDNPCVELVLGDIAAADDVRYTDVRIDGDTRTIFAAARIALAKKLRTARNIAVFFEDILFCVIAACAVTVLIFYANSGRIRAFAPIFCALGFALWYHTAGRLITAFSENIVCALRAVLRLLLRLIYKLLLRPPLAAVRFIWGVTAGKHIERRRKARHSACIRRDIAYSAQGFGLYRTANTADTHAKGGHKKKKHSRPVR